ncbi:MAG: trigger factor, partial [Candidatus Methylomirabilales bacterium]
PMKISLEELSGCKRALVVEVPVESVRSKMEEIISRLGRTVALPGFRKGKVPRELIERRFKDEVKSEVMRELIPRASRQAIQEANLNPISEPTLEEATFEEGQPLRFRVSFEVKPSIQLSHYKGVDVFRERVSVSEEEVDRALHLLQEGSAEYVPMEGWPALRDDLVIVDYEGFIGGRPFKGGKGENVAIILGSGESLPGFEEELYGLQKMETKTFTVEIPSDYPRRDLAGKKILFKVTVKEIKKRRISPLDDEFARSKGCENLGELKEQLKRELLQRKERAEEERLKEKILEKVIEAHPFEPPESLVEAELNGLLSEALRSLPQGRDPEKEAEVFRQRLREAAKRRVKASLILETIAQAEGLEVGEEEVDRELKALAASLNRDEAHLRGFFSGGRLEGLKARLKERKALEFLYQQARITESLNLVTLV